MFKYTHMHKTSISCKKNNYACKVAVKGANFFLLSQISTPSLNDNNSITTRIYELFLFSFFLTSSITGSITFQSYVNLESDIELSKIVR